MSTCLKTHGGKGHLAKKIVGLMPPHKRYLEAYFGGGSVLFAKPCEGVAEWVNDLNSDLWGFWIVLKDPERFAAFQRMVEATPLCVNEFDTARAMLDSDVPDKLGWDKDSITRAYLFFIRNRMSRQGLGKDYCTPTKRRRRGMNENVSAWLTAVDGLPEFHARIRRVEIWNRPAVEAIQALDGEDFLAYCDPPYLFATRKTTGEYGKHEMTNEQHAELLDTLANMKGKFMLSGYPSELYQQAEDKHGWNRVTFSVANSASGAKEKDRKQECLWMNF